jgi:hypothetical protein
MPAVVTLSPRSQLLQRRGRLQVRPDRATGRGSPGGPASRSGRGAGAHGRRDLRPLRSLRDPVESESPDGTGEVFLPLASDGATRRSADGAFRRGPSKSADWTLLVINPLRFCVLIQSGSKNVH